MSFTIWGTFKVLYKGALTQKRSVLVLCTTFRSDFHASWKNQNNHSTLNSSFNALSKWHEPDIKITSVFWSKFDHFGHRDILRTVIFFSLSKYIRNIWAPTFLGTFNCTYVLYLPLNSHAIKYGIWKSKMELKTFWIHNWFCYLPSINFMEHS